MMRSRTFFITVLGLLTGAVVLLPANESFAQSYAQAACTMEYLPVCGLKNGRTKTYPNACVARSEGARVVAKGKCRHRGVVVRG